ncbi:MAG TPA: class I SAM-dependent methyltransferase [Chthoniobacterales bacterium]
MPGIAMEQTPVRLTIKGAEWLEGVLRDGAFAVDATVGNGYDTLFLAHRVGPAGHVLGFDVQKGALTNATEMLRFAGLLDRVTLTLSSHAEMGRFLAPERRIAACTFSLGFLPRGDRRITTRPETTLVALDAAVTHLESHGRITILAYRKSLDGEEEYQAVKAALAEKDGVEVTEWMGSQPEADAPRLFLVAAATGPGTEN